MSGNLDTAKALERTRGGHGAERHPLRRPGGDLALRGVGVQVREALPSDSAGAANDRDIARATIGGHQVPAQNPLAETVGPFAEPDPLADFITY